MPDTNQFRRLNEEFYAADPSAYFRDRLQMLILRASNHSLIDDNAGDGTVWGNLRIIIQEDDEGPAQSEAEHDASHSRFLAAESQVLLHHAAEALLRMYLAHEGSPDCPWLEIAAMKAPGLFPKAAAELAKSAWSPDRSNAAGWVFLGGIPAADPPPEEWTSARDAAVRLLRTLAAKVNGDSQLYNAAKHGFTALAGTGSLHFLPGEPGDLDDVARLTVAQMEQQAVMGAEGVNIAFLERDGKPKSGYKWFKNTRWVTPEQDAYLAHLAIRQMHLLWTMARCHYLDDPLPQVVHPVTSDELDGWRDFPRRGNVLSWRQQVAWEPPAERSPGDTS